MRFNTRKTWFFPLSGNEPLFPQSVKLYNMIAGFSQATIYTKLLVLLSFYESDIFITLSFMKVISLSFFFISFFYNHFIPD